MQVKKEVPVEVVHFPHFARRCADVWDVSAPIAQDISVVLGTIGNLEEGS
jgi:hypothetical protein